MAEKTLLHVEGMTCANCANTITKTLQKEGLKEVNVNYLTTEVTFEEIEPGRLEKIKSQIGNIGYKVVDDVKHNHTDSDAHEHHGHTHSASVDKKFFLCALFTAP